MSQGAIMFRLARGAVNRTKQSVAAWRWVFNFERAFAHMWDCRRPVSDMSVSDDLKALRTDGLIVRQANEFFSQATLLDQISAEISARMEDDSVRAALQCHDSGSDRKAYRLHLLPGELALTSPFVQLGLEPRLLRLVNRYLGLRSCLRAIVVWLDFPTPAEAKETQLWHRDSDDTLNLKVFVYLSDVTADTGPFCFVPGTHRLGALKVQPCQDAGTRTTDAEMAKVVEPRHWQVCTGSARTVIVADTTGYHKGLKPVAGHRVLLQFHYTSGASNYPRQFSLREPEAAALCGVERYAVLK